MGTGVFIAQDEDPGVVAGSQPLWEMVGKRAYEEWMRHGLNAEWGVGNAEWSFRRGLGTNAE